MSNSGEWYITVVDATVVKGFDLFSKSDLYVRINFGGKSVKTKTAKNQDCPVWNETFAFPFDTNDNSNVEAIVTDDDMFKDDVITVANISRKQFPALAEEKEYSIPLSYKNKDVGILHIRMRNGVKGSMNSNNINYASSMESSYNHNNHNNNNNYNNISQAPLNSNNISSSSQYHNTHFDSTISPNNANGYNSTMLGGHSHSHNVYNDNGNSHIISHTVQETKYIDCSDQCHHLNNVVPIGVTNTNTTLSNFDTTNNINNVIPSNNINNVIPSNHTTTTTTTTENTNVLEHLVPSSEITKKHKTKRNKVRLPEKHHHYEDGYTSSSSESSNEGEKIRAAQGNLGGSDLNTKDSHYVQ